VEVEAAFERILEIPARVAREMDRAVCFHFLFHSADCARFPFQTKGFDIVHPNCFRDNSHLLRCTWDWGATWCFRLTDNE